jgi:Holliday junction resolvase-like predicted endonuclease
MTRLKMTKDQIISLSDIESKQFKKVSNQLARSKKSVITVNDLIEKYKAQLLNAEAHLTDLKKTRALSPRGKLLESARSLTDHYRLQWYDVDAAVGEIGQDNGQKLESRSNEIVEIVSNKAGVKVLHVWTNCYWNDKLGEVDIVLQTAKGDYVLIEVKARVFDVMAGWLQSGPKRHPHKIFLTLPGVSKAVQVPRDALCFVVTVLPINPYVLKCEVSAYCVKQNFAHRDTALFLLVLAECSTNYFSCHLSPICAAILSLC